MTRSIPVALLLLTAFAGCRQDKPAPEANLPQANLRIETVHTQLLADTLDLPGRVEADPQHLVHIYAPLSGRLINLRLTPGQEVQRGQTIATLQSGDVAQARADFEKAHIETLRADHSLDRGKLLYAHEVMSQADLQDLQAIADAAHSEQARAIQRIHELGFSEKGTADTTAITAPISGTAIEVNTASGEMQRSLETANGIATIANLDTVWVTGDLFERHLAIVNPRQTVQVTFPAYPGQTFTGTVANIGDSLDPATHALKIRVVLPNPGHRLKPAMFATLRIARPTQSRILLPQSAVLHDGDATQVYIPSPGGKYVLRTVTTGAIHNKQIEILAGLHEGEQVVTEGAAFLREPAAD